MTRRRPERSPQGVEWQRLSTEASWSTSGRKSSRRWPRRRQRSEAPTPPPRVRIDTGGSPDRSDSASNVAGLMEEICERRESEVSDRASHDNDGSPGGIESVCTVEGRTSKALAGHQAAVAERHLRAAAGEAGGDSQADGGVRKLGIPTVLDRFIQQAVLQVLQRYWDRTFSEHSYGFRPETSAHQAVAAGPRLHRRRATAGSWTSIWRSSSTGSTTTS